MYNIYFFFFYFVSLFLFFFFFFQAEDGIRDYKVTGVQTCALPILPWEPNTLFFLGEFDAAAEAICPRGLLRRVLARADAMGFKVFGACEFELDRKSVV